LYSAGHLEQALTQGQQLASLHSDEPILHNFIGVVNTGLGNTENAIASYTRAIKLEPGYAEAYCNLGVALQHLGRNQEAISSYSKAIQLQPGYANAHFSLGSALKNVGRHVEAVTSYTRAIKLKPDYAEAHNNLGNALKFLGRNEEASASFTRAIQLNPNNAEAHNNLGHMLFELSRYEEALASYAAALRYKPDFADAQAKTLYVQALLGNWGAVQSSAASIPGLGLSGEVVGPFVMLALEDHPARHLKRSELYAKKTFQRHEELPTVERPEVEAERLRIGYFSADFHDHATMRLMIRLFELHDSDEFVIHAYSFGPRQPDSMSNRLKEAVDVFHDVRHLGDREISELSRSEGIDIAVDLKGYTQDARPGIFAHRAAPIQISYLGYPGTSGMPSIDYIIADEFVIPKEQRGNYSEQIIYLPHSYQVNDNSRQISDEAISRVDAGLPETGFVFCCFNNNYKIGPAEFDIWMRLLQQVEGSVLWLLRSNKWVEDNFRREVQNRGVNPERVILADKMPLAEHLARHHLADLFLDTFICNAHTTASDALWAGLPVITKMGQGFAARVAGSLLNATGLPELATNSEQDYEQLALELALQPERLAALKNKLAANRLTTALFDTEQFTRDIEDAYRQAYRRYFDGKEPDTIFVQR
jgi:predicted O-linked N-acetylglucosamine transferase (SPINDLY family)